MAGQDPAVNWGSCQRDFFLKVKFQHQIQSTYVRTYVVTSFMALTQCVCPIKEATKVNAVSFLSCKIKYRTENVSAWCLPVDSTRRTGFCRVRHFFSFLLRAHLKNAQSSILSRITPCTTYTTHRYAHSNGFKFLLSFSHTRTHSQMK